MKDEIWTIVSPRRPTIVFFTLTNMLNNSGDCHSITANLMPLRWYGQNAKENMTTQ
jgi:hypothetical protein